MGTIYLNIETGEIFEGNIWRKKPPKEGVWERVARADYRYMDPEIKKFYCPACQRYHAVFHPFKMPLYKQIYAEFGEKYGCEIAQDIVSVGQALGGKRIHYQKAEQIVCSPKWAENREKFYSSTESERKFLAKELSLII